MENFILVLTALNTMLILTIGILLRHHLFPRGIEVYLNGQRMREGDDEDYLLKDGSPVFNFPLKPRGEMCPDIVLVRQVPLVPTHELHARTVIEEDEEGNEISRVVLATRSIDYRG